MKTKTKKKNQLLHQLLKDVSFNDMLDILRSDFDVEKNSKNEAYAYILSRGLLDDFTHFSRNEVSNNPFSDCLNMISLCITDNN